MLSDEKKRAKQIKKWIQQGLMDPKRAELFSLFLQTSDMKYCLYSKSEQILGNTFDMCILQVIIYRLFLLQLLVVQSTYSIDVVFLKCVLDTALQDFEALTPNLLARIIETVEGGGLIVLLLRSLSSLSSLYTMVMVCFLHPCLLLTR